jgi:DNA-binding winged helix-turn-helix (wHTH) protein/tetratricopeptide (TPR) repeat protein
MSTSTSRETYRFGDFVLDVASYQLRENGRPVRLERQPMDLLILLVEGRRQLVSRGEIADRLWSKDVFVDVETGVNTAIRKIRQALHDSSETPRFVETVSGKGYRFIAPVEVIPASPDPPAMQVIDSAVTGPPATVAIVTTAEEVSQVSPPPARSTQTGTGITFAQSGRGQLIAVALACALAGVVTWSWQRARTAAAVSELEFKASFYRTRWSEAEIRKGIDYYHRAIALDPDALDSYSGLASAWTLLSDLHVSPREAMPRARAAVEEVLRRDEARSGAHLSLAVIKLQYDWDFAGADREFARAMELEPDDADARVLRGWLRMAEGRLADAQADMRRAVDADPSSELALWSLGLSFYFERQYETAIEQYRRAIAVEPRSYWAHLSLGWAYARQGRVEDAVVEFEQARRLIDTPQAVAALVYAQAAAGRGVEAQATMASLLEYSKRKYVSAYDLATAFAGLGDRTETLAWLEKAYEERSGWLALWLKIDPTFDSLRDDSRFRDLLARVGHAPFTERAREVRPNNGETASSRPLATPGSPRP